MPPDIEHFHSFLDPEQPEVRERLVAFIGEHCAEDAPEVVAMLGLNEVLA